ncbi:glycine dehydrogenase subunit 2 [Deinobacterium chartae]|uniref:glycine dehydrogenase (aminomethyl-transferring) n=1 Tax=Deinobacterium chartae TaxID=521158 RepID=A0A841I2Q8_9DEIO|nr:aminomethyl-transferring glycine dehydrogenase subunit GcvPB [Deinobacterium chartae]MBB6098659.1 glycine dehydrogenase subunit 2 [Deinobacterium chartae]
MTQTLEQRTSSVRENDYALIFERSQAGRRASVPPRIDGSLEGRLPTRYRRQTPLNLPEVSELDLVRHYTALAHRQFSVDGNFYPLGSCTMKYNPKVHEQLAPEFQNLHPYQDPSTLQGALELLYHLQRDLSAITGMDHTTLQPAAGAHGELAGLLMIRAYHVARGEGETRKVVLVPDGAHGTNPATASMVGYEVQEIASLENGEVDADALIAAMGPQVAAIMLTNPNTVGVFEREIVRIARAAHGHGIQLYYDGANANAIVGRARPGDMGFDVIHLNLHKTFTVPHGGGGPGTGPVGFKAHLAPYAPVPMVVRREDGRFDLEYDRPESIGRVRSFYGNFGNLVRAYTYIRSLGAEGLKDASTKAVLNANYLRVGMQRLGFKIRFERVNMHEFVAQPPEGLRTLDLAKAMLDYGIHPMTVYFPLHVREAMMVEPTETESLETLDHFLAVMGEILQKAQEPGYLEGAPYTTPVRRLDEVMAAKRPVLSYRKLNENR